MAQSTTCFRVIDSHTGGEPTRTLIGGGPNLDGSETSPFDVASFLLPKGNGTGAVSMFTVKQRVDILKNHFDHYRRSLVNEPRGSEVMVGALVIPPHDPKNLAGVIFFNNVGYLGMCGHGTIGVVETLRYLGLLEPGLQTLETCVGDVRVKLHTDSRVTVENVPSYRIQTKHVVSIAGLPTLHADIAYGGNWFCLIECPDPAWLDLGYSELIALTQKILEEVRKDYPEVDHVELFGPPRDSRNHSRSFVLCPGGQFDRSPCGTGTSAKLACLAADGKLSPEETWRQESIIGSVFEAEYQWKDFENKIILPSITARAFVNGDFTVIADEEDPFAWGIR
jgi:proline racemase